VVVRSPTGCPVGIAARLPATLDWFATVDGPFASRTRIGPDGEQWITLSSAGHAMLTQRLGELLGELP
jgi:hypothetical protein